MPNDLVLLERQFDPLLPQLREALAGLMPVERLVRTLLMSVERNPRLLECNRQSLFNSGMTLAVLGLEADGVTGQAYLLPFKKMVQPCIGYRGYNTLGARSHITIDGAVVREGDEFDYNEGTGAFVRHKKLLGNESSRRIIAAWAAGSAHDRPPVIRVMSIDELNEVKARAPGAKTPDSPWNDPKIGLPAMYEKTPKRRLARSMPLNVMQLAARLDEAFEEQGRYGFIGPDRALRIEGETSPIPDRDTNQQPTAAALIRGSTPSGAVVHPASGPTPPSVSQAPTHADGGGSAEKPPSAEQYAGLWDSILIDATDPQLIRDGWKVGGGLRKKILWPEDENDRAHWTQIKARAEKKIKELEGAPPQ